MSRGIAISGSFEELPAFGEAAEASGYDAVWVSETDQSAVVQAAVVAAATKSIRVGTNITLAFPRSPVATAMEAWDLAALSHDRFVLGLGSQVRRIIEERFSSDFDRPAQRMAEYVQAMRATWRMEQGHQATFEGEIYRVRRPGVFGYGSSRDRSQPPVYVAAVGPMMTQVAARHADGLLGHPFTSDRYITGALLPRVEAALADAGRDRSEFSIAQGVMVAVADDTELARQDIKAQIAFYGTTPNYQGVFASYGDEDLTADLRTVFRESGQDREAMAAAVPDEAVDRYAVVGTPKGVADRLAELEALVDHLILIPPWYQVPHERRRQNLAALLAHKS